eukprot:5423852-Heterocapsa_arctica.AAC.1
MLCKDAAADQAHAAADRLPGDLVFRPVAGPEPDDVVHASSLRQPDADVLRACEVATEALQPAVVRL